jgi:hypothetical protein
MPHTPGGRDQAPPSPLLKEEGPITAKEDEEDDQEAWTLPLPPPISTPSPPPLMAEVADGARSDMPVPKDAMASAVM